MKCNFCLVSLNCAKNFLEIHALNYNAMDTSRDITLHRKRNIVKLTKARFHVTVRTQINKSVVYFIIRRNVKFGYSEC